LKTLACSCEYAICVTRFRRGKGASSIEKRRTVLNWWRQLTLTRWAPRGGAPAPVAHRRRRRPQTDPTRPESRRWTKTAGERRSAAKPSELRGHRDASRVALAAPRFAGRNRPGPGRRASTLRTALRRASTDSALAARGPPPRFSLSEQACRGRVPACAG